MPKRRSLYKAHRADTCHKAIRKECRAWGLKRHQYDAAVALWRIEHGYVPFLKRVVVYAATLFFDSKKLEKRLERSWIRDSVHSAHRTRSRGFTRRKLNSPLLRGATVMRKVRRKK